jgi:hypothetical protein
VINRRDRGQFSLERQTLARSNNVE